MAGHAQGPGFLSVRSRESGRTCSGFRNWGDSDLPDPPLPLGLQLDKLQRLLENGASGEQEAGKEPKTNQLNFQLGMLR